MYARGRREPTLPSEGISTERMKDNQVSPREVASLLPGELLRCKLAAWACQKNRALSPDAVRLTGRGGGSGGRDIGALACGGGVKSSQGKKRRPLSARDTLAVAPCLMHACTTYGSDARMGA